VDKLYREIREEYKTANRLIQSAVKNEGQVLLPVQQKFFRSKESAEYQLEPRIRTLTLVRKDFSAANNKYFQIEGGYFIFQSTELLSWFDQNSYKICWITMEALL